ncbi:MAG: hypothetical protein H7838_06440 [Magnetococcus sp. DMHC-8]
MAPSWFKRFGKGKEAAESPVDQDNQEPQVVSTDWDGPDLDAVYPESRPGEAGPVAVVAERKSTVTEVLAYLFILLVLLLLVPATIVSTFEIANRVDFIAYLDKELARHKTELGELDKMQTKADPNQKARTALVAEVNALEKFREAAYVITANGAIPLTGDLFSFRDLIVLKAKSAQGASPLAAILQGDAAINKSKSAEGSPVIAHIHKVNQFVDNLNDAFSGFVCHYSSNSLLAVSLILSSIIGSLACYFNRNGESPLLLRGIISGLVMGFIVYLVVKGGRDIFMAGKEHDLSLSLNLYGSCLAAFLAGTLADRLFRLLRSLLGLLGQKG